MRCLLPAVLLFCWSLTGETVDRLAVTVGPTVITELQIDEDLRVASLINGQPVARDAESRRAAADRLVEQLLIGHEIEISRYPPPSKEEVDAYYLSIEKAMGGAKHLNELLEKYSVSEGTLRAHLAAQLLTLRFIEFRFRSDVNVSDAEIENTYTHQLTALPGGGTLKPPVLDANLRARISQSLLEERTDAALNSWLAEARKQVNIRYIDESLR